MSKIMLILDILKWLNQHKVELAAAYAALVTAASIIVKLTPTLSDDNALLKVIKFLSRYVALNRTVPDNQVRAELRNGKVK